MGTHSFSRTLVVVPSTAGKAGARSLRLLLCVGIGLLTFPACTVGTAQAPAPTPAAAPAREPDWIAGEVVGVNNIPIEEYNESTVQLIVATEGEKKVRVRLAPGWFLDEQGLDYRREQRIEFHGDPDPAEQDLVFARGIRAGSTTLELRDASGVERWRLVKPLPLGSNPLSDGGLPPLQSP